MAIPTFPSLRGIAFPVKRGQKWSTVKNDALSGKRTRVSLYTYPTYEYEATFNFLRTAAGLQEWQQLSDFISNVYGGTQIFGYSDPNDGAVTNQPFGEGNGVSQYFQLVRTLYSFTEPVFLTNGTPNIFLNGVQQVLNTDYGLSATANIAFKVPPPNGAQLTWTGSYLWACRFDEDITPFSNIWQGMFELKSLKFSTEKVDIILAVPPS